MLTARSAFDTDSLRAGPAAQRMIAPGVALAVGGAAVAAWLGWREEGRTLFLHAYLVAFLFYLSITLGALFFVILHHLARAGWSVALRRLAEALSANMLLMAILFLPILANMGRIYEWWQPHGEASQAAAAGEEGKAAAEPGSGESAETYKGFAGRNLWLTQRGFIFRFAVYFLVWIGLASYFRNQSVRQDESGDVGRSAAMGRLSAPGMILFSVTLTGAAVDLIMSLNPHWATTMVGVYFFADAVLSGLVVLTLLAMWLQANGLLRGVVTVEHYHDLGKLTFAFVFFWGYIAFSQYMLIWYANIPEETQFYIPRQLGPWAALGLTLVVFHLLIPFLGLMSRHVKRNTLALSFWLIWLLVAHALDLFWLIMPNTYIQKIPEAVGMPGATLPEAFKHLLASHQSVYSLSQNYPEFAKSIMAPLDPTSLAVLAGLLAGMGGLYLANTGRLLQTASLVPVRDPRLDEAIEFQNT